jgi:serine protease Do
MFVQSGSAAAAAGIQQGDIIATIDGHKLPDFDRLTVRIAQHQPGDKIEVEIIRNDQRMKLTPVLGIRPEHE